MDPISCFIVQRWAKRSFEVMRVGQESRLEEGRLTIQGNAGEGAAVHLQLQDCLAESRLFEEKLDLRAEGAGDLAACYPQERIVVHLAEDEVDDFLGKHRGLAERQRHVFE
jgi:hypothetical protein